MTHIRMFLYASCCAYISADWYWNITVFTVKYAEVHCGNDILASCLKEPIRICMTQGDAIIIKHHAKTNQNEFTWPWVVQISLSIMLKQTNRNLHNPG